MKAEKANDVLERYVKCGNTPCPNDKPSCDECELKITAVEWDKALETAIEAMEKQKAKRWIKEDRGHVEYRAVCPDCGYDTFWSDTEDFNYCPSCGQALSLVGRGSEG